MQCCVPYCKNTPDNVSTAEMKRVSFHGFPTDLRLRAEWLKALGKQHSHLPESAIVCSKHFVNEDTYETESGVMQIVNGAIPSIVQVCMICLDTDSKLILMSKKNLEEPYEKLTGHPMCELRNIKQTLCIQCAQSLINFNKFRNKSLRARALMMELVGKHKFITRRHIKMINRTRNQLKSNLVVTKLGPDPCDLYILDDPKDKQIHTVAVKNEHRDLDDGHIEMAIDENSSDSVDDGLETKPLDVPSEAFDRTTEDLEQLKCDSAPLQCTVSSHEFACEHEYCLRTNSKISDVACEAQASKPSTVYSRALHDHLMENKNSATPDAPYPIPVLDHMPVTPLSGMNTENDLQAKEDDVEHKSEKVFKIDNDEIKIDMNNIKDVRITNNIDKLRRVSREKRKIVESHIDTKDFNCEVIKIKDIKPIAEVPVNNQIKVEKTKVSKISQNDTNCTNDTNRTVKRTKKMIIKKHIKAELTSKVSMFKKVVIKNNTEKEKDSIEPYSCNICKYKCGEIPELTNHMKTHTVEKRYNCNYCEYKCTQKCILVAHLRIHTGEKPFFCEICGYTCAQNANLLRHMKTHTGEKPYPCKLCKRQFADKGNLMSHLKTHSGEKPFTCKFCEYKSARSSNLKKHMRVHTGEKPYLCELCDYRSAHKSMITQHMRIHTGEKPYSCTYCEYKCARETYLVRHIRTHVKPYSCKLCDYKCARSNALANHMRSHVHINPPCYDTVC